MINIPAAAALLEAMGNPIRFKILCLLCDGELSVNEICDAVALEASPTSQHLRKFRELGVVTTRRQAQQVFYSCKSDAVRKLIETLREIIPTLTMPR